MLAAAWCGAALFLASLLYFAYFYLVRLGSPAAVAAVEVPGILALDTLLFSVFALHHSLFARAGVKAWLARVLPAGAERSLYVWIASALFLAVCLLWQPLPGLAWQISGAGRWLLHALQLAGLVVTLRSASRIDVWELAGVRQVRATAAPRPAPARTSGPSGAGASALEVSGPYRWVRHPIYLGWILLVWPVATMTMSRLLFAALSTAYLVVAIPFEERSLMNDFGPAYASYRRRVRWRLLPGVW